MIPTLEAGPALAECLDSLAAQTLGRDLEVIVVDNSGRGRAREAAAPRGVQVIENQTNVGFGAAINQGIERSHSPFVATLNDDAAACPGWAEALVRAAGSNPQAGMCASRVVLSESGQLDSAGMRLAADGSSKQRGHGEDPHLFDRLEEVLCPSGSAALYRRAMLEQVGGFDGDFFLYCEDTDLGLRARRAGWRCLYVPEARVTHRYSHSAGRASPLKAYYVERNRLSLACKNFPASMLWRVPFVEIARYFWHVMAILEGRGAGAQFRREGHNAVMLPLYVIGAHFGVLARLPRLMRQRREIACSAALSSGEYSALLRRYSISAREVAAL